MTSSTILQERYQIVQARIDAATARSGRPPGSVTLVAVTKTWPAGVVLQAYAAGMRHFGENRPEELAAKRQAVESEIGRDSGIVWHLIGTLQSRKTRLAAEHADVFHALDREKIARRLSTDLSVASRTLPVFLEVNLSGESTKAGLNMQNWETDATQRETLRNEIKCINDLPGLAWRGLMTMAPWDVEPAIIRSVFQRTRELSEWLTGQNKNLPPLELSMGMTDDFEIAIEEGATIVRVGRAIFGERV